MFRDTVGRRLAEVTKPQNFFIRKLADTSTANPSSGPSPPSSGSSSLCHNEYAQGVDDSALSTSVRYLQPSDVIKTIPDNNTPDKRESILSMAASHANDSDLCLPSPASGRDIDISDAASFGTEAIDITPCKNAMSGRHCDFSKLRLDSLRTMGDPSLTAIDVELLYTARRLEEELAAERALYASEHTPGMPCDAVPLLENSFANNECMAGNEDASSISRFCAQTASSLQHSARTSPRLEEYYIGESPKNAVDYDGPQKTPTIVPNFMPDTSVSGLTALQNMNMLADNAIALLERRE